MYYSPVYRPAWAQATVYVEGTGKQRIQRRQEDSSCLAPKQTCNCQYFPERNRGRGGWGSIHSEVRTEVDWRRHWLPTDSPLTAEPWLLQCTVCSIQDAAEYSSIAVARTLYDGR